MKRVIPDTITEEELQQLIKKVKSHKKRLAYCLGFYQCMRVSEVTNLRPEHIDKGRMLLMIKQAKGNKDRNVPISPLVLNGLKHLPIGVGVRALQISFKKIAKEVLGKDLHFHSLRHSGATFYLNVRKWNIRVVQTFLGHADIGTTMIYTHISPDDLMRAMLE